MEQVHCFSKLSDLCHLQVQWQKLTKLPQRDMETLAKLEVSIRC